jgi:hypothetical protein
MSKSLLAGLLARARTLADAVFMLYKSSSNRGLPVSLLPGMRSGMASDLAGSPREGTRFRRNAQPGEVNCKTKAGLAYFLLGGMPRV